MYGDHRVIKVCSKPVAGTAPCRISGGMLRACISLLRGALLCPGHFIQSPVCCHTGFAPESGLEDSGRHEEVLTLGCSEVQSPPYSSQERATYSFQDLFLSHVVNDWQAGPTSGHGGLTSWQDQVLTVGEHPSLVQVSGTGQ